MPVQAVNKVKEGRPHIVDMIKNGEIQLVLTTVMRPAPRLPTRAASAPPPCQQGHLLHDDRRHRGHRRAHEITGQPERQSVTKPVLKRRGASVRKNGWSANERKIRIEFLFAIHVRTENLLLTASKARPGGGFILPPLTESFTDERRFRLPNAALKNSRPSCTGSRRVERPCGHQGDCRGARPG